MKILLINTLYTPHLLGGAEKSVQQLAEKLHEYGHEPLIISTSTKDEIGYVNGVKVHYLNYRNMYWGIESTGQSFMKKLLWHGKDVYNWTMKAKLEQIFDEEKPDIVHTNNLSGFSVVPWIIAKKRNLPVVHTLRDYYLLCPQSAMFRDGKNCENRCTSCKVFSEYKRLLTNRGYVNHVVGISQFILNRHKQFDYFKGVSASKIFNGITASSLTSSSNSKDSNEGKLIFLYMGRIEEAKGVYQLVDTFLELTNVELWLGGRVTDSELRGKIERGEYPEHIKFLGYIDPKEVLPRVNALIIPSLWHEPFGRVVFEAFAYGIPVIGTNRGGIPEIIDEGRTGFIYDPNVPHELRNLLQTLCENTSRLRDLTSSLLPTLTENSLERTVEKYINIYRELIVPAVDIEAVN